MTVPEYGALHGVSKQAASKWKKRGWLVFEGTKVNVEESSANLKKYRSSRSTITDNQVDHSLEAEKKVVATVLPGETTAQAAERIMLDVDITMDINEARRVKESYLALLNQLEYDKKSGLVVMADQVLKTVGEEYAKFRTKVLSIPSEQAPRIHRLKTVNEVQDALHELLSEALKELTADEI